MSARLPPRYNLLIARLPCGTQRGLLPLLPSGPDGVCNHLLRRTRLSTRSFFRRFHWRPKPCEVYGKPCTLRGAWRRERDSNPRSRYERNTRFPIVPLRPLGHLSVIQPPNHEKPVLSISSLIGFRLLLTSYVSIYKDSTAVFISKYHITISQNFHHRHRILSFAN